MIHLMKMMLPVVDIFLVPLLFPAAWLLKAVRKAGVHRLPACRSVLMRVGVFPIQDHYYEPQFDNRNPRSPFSQDRHLSGIDWNVAGQLEFLDRFSYAAELKDVPMRKTVLPQLRGLPEFYFNNGAFESGDAEYWYQLIRAIKPSKIIEIGSGHSTLMAVKALRANRAESPSYACEHICIEPYEMPWLESTGASILRKKVEDVELSFFSRLREGDILFIDSSHVIRPQGDVLFEYLELLPTLNKGVIVHVHDIFSPRNYPNAWLSDEIKLWNEQYLLEAFLSHNHDWEIIGALNQLHHHHHDQLQAIAPFLSADREPGSFYLRKVT